MYKVKKRIPRKHLYRTMQAQQHQLQQLAEAYIKAKHKYDFKFQFRRFIAWVKGQA